MPYCKLLCVMASERLLAGLSGDILSPSGDILSPMPCCKLLCVMASSIGDISANANISLSLNQRWIYCKTWYTLVQEIVYVCFMLTSVMMTVHVNFNSRKK